MNALSKMSASEIVKANVDDIQQYCVCLSTLARRLYSCKESLTFEITVKSYLAERYLMIDSSDSLHLAKYSMSSFAELPAALVAPQLEKLLPLLIRREPHNSNETEATNPQMYDEPFWEMIFK